MNKQPLEFECSAPDGSLVRVSYVKEWMRDLDHFEFRGDATSETGYRSHFVHGGIGDITPEAAADQIIASLYKERFPDQYQSGQQKLL